MDYINAELPIIMSGSFDASRVIEENNCGIVIRSDSENEIAKAISEMCNSEKLSIYTNNIKKISKNYSSESQIDIICDFVNKIN